MLRVFLSIPLGTKMFQFPRSSSITLYIQVMMICISTNRVSPFGHPRIKACLGAPRGLSHPATSFIVSLCQGIHHMLLAYDSTKAHNVLFLYMSRQKHIKWCHVIGWSHGLCLQLIAIRLSPDRKQTYRFDACVIWIVKWRHRSSIPSEPSSVLRKYLYQRLCAATSLQEAHYSARLLILFNKKIDHTGPIQTNNCLALPDHIIN